MDPALNKPVFYCIVSSKLEDYEPTWKWGKENMSDDKATIKTEDKQSPQCIMNPRIEKKCAWASLWICVVCTLMSFFFH